MFRKRARRISLMAAVAAMNTAIVDLFQIAVMHLGVIRWGNANNARRILPVLNSGAFDKLAPMQ